MFGRERGVIEAATRADVIKLFPATACSVWQDALYPIDGSCHIAMSPQMPMSLEAGETNHDPARVQENAYMSRQ
jgi:hypothetical protein